MDDMFFRYPNDQYNEGISIEEYKGEYALVLAREGNDGKVWKKWVFPQGKDRQPIAKSIPLGVKLGDKENAIAMLKAILAYLGDEPKEDIPF